MLEEGPGCGLHRIERLMRGEPLWRHWFEPVGERRDGAAAEDDGGRSVSADTVLDRDFQADRSNQTRLANFAYVWTAGGWLYAAAVMCVSPEFTIILTMKPEILRY